MTEGARPAGASFLEQLRRRAAAAPRRIVFPEGGDPRVLDAAAEAVRDGLYEPVVLGERDRVWPELARRGVGDRDALTVLDPRDPDHLARIAEAVEAGRRSRGGSSARPGLRAEDPVTQAAALVALGDVDGGVAGAVATTASVVRAALRLIGMEQAGGALSSAFYMVFPETHALGARVLSFTDAGVLPEPSASELAGAAHAAALSHERVVGEAPRVAFLSFSTRGSAEGRTVTLARRALEIFREVAPDIAADGEMQADAALVREVADRKAPGSAVAGRANVLVFPDLAAANISYKLVQHLGGATALGPILQGLRRPFNDLSRGSSADDIVAVGCVTAAMAGARRRSANEGRSAE